jgi:hypothetical protein
MTGDETAAHHDSTTPGAIVAGRTVNIESVLTTLNSCRVNGIGSVPASTPLILPV